MPPGGKNRRAAERSFLFECFILLGFSLTPQGIGIAKGDDVDGLHQTVAHPELNVGLDGVAAAGVGHPLLRVDVYKRQVEEIAQLLAISNRAAYNLCNTCLLYTSRCV